MLREGLRREVPRPQAERRVPLMEGHSVQAELSRQEHPEAARPDVPDGLHRACPARPSAAAARKAPALRAMEAAEAAVAQRLAQTARLVPPVLRAAGAVAVAVREVPQAPQVAAAQPRAAPEVWDAVVGRQPAAGSAAGAARQPEAAAVQDVAAAEQRQAAGPAAAAAPLRGAEVAVPDAEEAPLRGAEAEGLDAAAEVLRRVARDGPGAPLLAAAWAGLPSTRLQGGRLAPSARARSAHARRCLRTAQP